MNAYSFVARQAILDVNGVPLGYELLFRLGLENRFPDIDAEQATRRLIAEQFLSDKIDDLVGSAMCFVNFPDTLLEEGLATALNHKNMVIEILEDARPTPQLLEQVKKLKAAGIKVALDDHVPGKGWSAFFPYVDFIKLDLRHLPLDECRSIIEQCTEYTALRFIAEKVETREEFNAAREAGFDYFQGYYFQQPQVIQRRLLTTDELTAFELLSAVSEKHIDYDRLTALFSRDLPLTYNLLRYVNSLHLGYKRQSIENLRNAIVYLGQEQLKRFTAMVMTAYISKKKNRELYRLSIVRARWCELLAEQLNNSMTNDAFMCGLFSLLDVLLERPIAEILPQLPVSEEVKQALGQGKGQLGFLLGLMDNHERANWNNLKQRLDFIGMEEKINADCYEKAICWSNQLEASRNNTP
ncbi:EAL and HDOD domain-containing protein [Oceanimonas baumannii]|uniref:Diguanylate phosphodiesterase n=1 Tax=Oceanimonas baumannii TaxID=129578 RepID=A0A235CKX3_9GAMM|nr:EAL domain-containing protein [Oceanimonas baumannii]OYD25213.1 diguanylate phosphodiesterase [Oceanimonas baumannii]TDW62494.1 EAL and modified HD-GYP domain-containing signal transduction protein [Oceanimonas baumannii]